MNAADIRSFILSAPGVSAIVGGRVYPGHIPIESYNDDSKKPCIVYNEQASSRNRAFCASETIRVDTVLVSCFSPSFDTARSVGALVEGLDAFVGNIGSTRIISAFIQTTMDMEDFEPGLFRRNIIFTIWNKDI